MNDWIEIGKLEDIAVQGARTVDTEEGTIAIFRTLDDEVFAIDNTCPHKGGPLSEGIVHGHAVTCPLHNWTMSLKTGEAQGPDNGCVKTFPVRVVDGMVFLGLGGGSGQLQAAE